MIKKLDLFSCLVCDRQYTLAHPVGISTPKTRVHGPCLWSTFLTPVNRGCEHI